MEKDPFLNFLSTLSDKIKVEREHKQLLEKINSSNEEINENKGSLEEFLVKLKEKISKDPVLKNEPIKNEEAAPSEVVPEKDINDIIKKDLESVVIETQEEPDFNVFVSKLKNILNAPKVINQDKAPVKNNIEKSEPDSKEKTIVDKEEVKSATKDYVEVLDQLADGVSIDSDQKTIEIKKLIEEYAEKYLKKAIVMSEYAGGGGTNAVQYANGGTMNGDLNVTGNYLSAGVDLLDIFASKPDSDNQTLSYNTSTYDLSISNGNTVNLSSIISVTNANSASWDSVYTTTKDTSGYWESAIQSVNGTANQIVATNTGTNNHDNQVTLALDNNTIFPGDVTIPGTLTVTGTATYINTDSLVINDPIIFLARNNNTNLVDTGFVSHFTLGAPLLSTHTGLIRRANQGVPGYWTLFSGLTTEPLTSANIDWDDPNIKLDTLSANIATNNGTSDEWNSTHTTVKSLSNSWNSAYTTSNTTSSQWTEAYTNLVSYSALYLSGYSDNKYFYKDLNFTANPNTKYSTGTIFDSITATLPSGSTVGDSIEFFDADGMWDINPLIINNNGYAIESIYDSLSCDVRYGIFKLINTSPNSLGWRIVPLPRHSEVNDIYKLVGFSVEPLYKVTASTCGRSSVSLSSFYWRQDYQALYSDDNKLYIQYNNILSGWRVIDYSTYPTTVIPYSAASISKFIFPSSGWVSLNPIYDPPPTFTIASNPPVSSFFFDSTPQFNNNDGISSGNTLYSYTSSTKIPSVTNLYFYSTPVTSVDLTYFKSLRLLDASQSTLSSLDVRRNINIEELYINSTPFKNIDLRNLKKLNYFDASDSQLESIQFPVDKNHVYSYINLNITKLKELIFKDSFVVSGIEASLIPTLTAIYFYNNSITDVYGGLFIYNNFNLLKASLTGNYIQYVQLNNNINLKDISLQTNSITGLYLNGCTSLSSLDLPQNLKSISINNCALSSSTFIDSMLSNIDNNNYTDGFITYANTAPRTAASNTNFINLIKRNYNLTPFEIDAPNALTRPTGYVPSQNSDSITVMNPISTRNGNPAIYNTISDWDYYSTRFTEMTGEYLKTVEVYNNRDVWKNLNDYFILFNNSLSGWTLVGPLSTSSTIWLSATESQGEWGTPPAVSWYGRAYQSGGFTGGASKDPATYGSVWAQNTTVASTRNTLFSSFYWGGPNGYDYATQGYLNQGQSRMFGLPSAGYNSSFYWKDYDFTGLLYNSGPTPMNTGRGILISPIHFLCQNHYLPWGGSGTTGAGQSLVLYNPDGTTTTRTVLSSRQYPNGSDTRVGILDAPVTNTFYPVASGTGFINNVLTDFTKLSCFFVGPFQDSKCGLMPLKIAGSYINWQVGAFSLSNLDNSFYKNSYSVPRSLIFGESIAGGDSSTQMWFLSADVKRPIIIGGVQYGGGSGPGFGVGSLPTFLQNTMNALSNQFSLPLYSPILVDK